MTEATLIFDYPDTEKCPKCYYWRTQIVPITNGIRIIARCFSQDETCGTCCFTDKNEIRHKKGKW